MVSIPILYNLPDIVQGDDRTEVINITSSTETIAVGDWSVFFTVKQSYSDSDSAAVVKVEPSSITTSTISSSSGQISIPWYARESSSSTASAVDAGTYVYDIQVIRDTKIETWFRGKVKILSEATVRVS